MTTNGKSYLLILLSGCLWGTIGFFVKLLNEYNLPPGSISFIRMFGAFLIMVPLTLAIEGRHAFKISKKTLIICMLMGLICQAIFNLSYSISVNSVGVSLSSVLLYTAPIYTTIMSNIFFSEKITKVKVVALLLNILGCILTVTGGSISSNNLSFMGILSGLGAGLFYSTAAIFGKFATEDSKPLAVCTYNFLFASIFLMIVSKPWKELTLLLSPEVLPISLGYAFFPTVLSYMLYFNGLKTIKESSKVPILASIETVVATFIGFFVFHERIGLINTLGILIVLFSIYIMNIKNKTAIRAEDNKFLA